MRVLRPCLAAGSAVLAAAALIAGSGAGPAGTVTAAGAASRAAHHAPSARLLAQARAALVRYLTRDHPGALALPATGKSAGLTSGDTYNWSGYADESSTHGTFTKASGAWTMPGVACTAEDTLASQWVGIDGANSRTVEQAGTLGWCYKDTPTYFTWYDIYPAATVEVGKSLRPGDKISASVSRSGSSYTLKLTDSTHTADSFTKTATCSTSTCLDTSAEWISERPSFSIGVAPLANYRTWKLTSGAETAGGKSGTIGSYATVDELTMIDATGAYALSTPSSLSGGTSFSTKWDNSY